MPSTSGESASGAGGVLIPPGQAEIAGAFPKILQPMIDQSVGGTSPGAQLAPFGADIWSRLQQSGAYPGALDQSMLGSQLLGPYISNLGGYAGGLSNFVGGLGGEAGSLAGLGGLAAGAAPTALGAGYNPAYGQAGALGNVLSQMIGGNAQAASGGFGVTPLLGHALSIGALQAPQILDAGQNPNYAAASQAGAQLAPQFLNATSSILNQAFDPQKELYNRTEQQLSDQLNAQNAMSGIAGTPYGAGVAGQGLSNFNIDWQNQQLQRMLSGAAGAEGTGAAAISSLINPANAGLAARESALTSAQGGLTGPGSILAGNQAQGYNTGAGLSGSALASLLSPANAASSASLQGTGALGNLVNSASSGYGGGLNLMSGGLGLTSGGLGLLNNAGQYGTNAALAPFGAGNQIGSTLSNLAGVGNLQYQLPQQTLNDILSYMGAGRDASSLANTIGSTNFNQLAAGLGGIGSLLGGPLGFGGSNGGLLGGALGLGGAGAGASAGSAAALGTGGLYEAAAAAAPLALSSDRRLKTRIKRIGQLDNGLVIYSYKIRGESQVGLMADEVEKVHPEAVITGPDGFKKVYYALAIKPRPRRRAMAA